MGQYDCKLKMKINRWWWAEWDVQNTARRKSSRLPPPAPTHTHTHTHNSTPGGMFGSYPASSSVSTRHARWVIVCTENRTRFINLIQNQREVLKDNPRFGASYFDVFCSVGQTLKQRLHILNNSNNDVIFWTTLSTTPYVEQCILHSPVSLEHFLTASEENSILTEGPTGRVSAGSSHLSSDAVPILPKATLKPPAN